MKASIIWVPGTITSEKYPVLKVETGRQNKGRDYIILSMSCSAYEEDKVLALAELQNIADRVNRIIPTPPHEIGEPCTCVGQDLWGCGYGRNKRG